MDTTKHEEEGRNELARMIQTCNKKTPDKKQIDDDEPKMYEHGIEGWKSLPPDEISNILNALFRRASTPETGDRLYFYPRPYRADYCPNCGYPVKLLRAVYMKLCMKMPEFKKMKLKPPSMHICPQCNLDLRCVEIVKESKAR